MINTFVWCFNFTMMKKIKFSCVVLIFLLCKAGLSLAQNDSLVKVNRVKYQQFRNNKESYEITKADLTGETNENTHSTAYYEGNDLKIIEVIYLAGNGHRQIEYYFDKENLFFALERNQPPDKIIAISKGQENNTENITVIENRYYFYKDKLICWYDNEKKEVDISLEAHSAVGTELIGQAYKMKEKLKK
ncbi:MAG: hypothetical protein ABIT08_14750 [Bacteroidia bacterium]